MDLLLQRVAGRAALFDGLRQRRRVADGALWLVLLFLPGSLLLLPVWLWWKRRGPR